MWSMNRDNFTSSFPICMPFIFFSCLTALARPSNAMSNGSAQNENSCFVPDLRGKSFQSFTIEYDVGGGFSYMAFNMLRKFPPNLLSALIIKGF